jgi:S-ribosylhomocysteine lyase LuxS involved in autoinducer biosynthesis
MGRIEIKDARRTVDGKKINAYRVRTIGENNEILQTSEILNTTEAVKKHIRAMALAWDSNGECEVVDCTYRGKFEGKPIELDQYDKLNYGLIS